MSVVITVGLAAAAVGQM